MKIELDLGGSLAARWLRLPGDDDRVSPESSAPSRAQALERELRR
jgi:hypothetical protein